MSTTKKWMAQLQKGANSAKLSSNPFADVLRTQSPSVNFTFGNTWGLPRGYTIALWGPSKGGKSLLLKSFIGQLHQDDPEAIVVVYDTEMRWPVQMTPQQCRAWGIDPDRLEIQLTNEPKGIFDHIEKEIWPKIQDGAPIKLIAIDSLSDMRGRRDMDSETVDDQQRGDEALTIQTGLKRILGPIRKGQVGFICVCQARAEQDTNKAKYTPLRMHASWALKHFAEYFMFVDSDRSKDSKEDLLGNQEQFLDESRKDMNDKAEKTAGKIKVTMQESSLGPSGRAAEFTWNLQEGVINAYEEIFYLAKNRGVLERPNDRTYIFAGRTWNSKEAMVKAIQGEPELQKALIQKLMEQDVTSILPVKDEPKSDKLKSIEE